MTDALGANSGDDVQDRIGALSPHRRALFEVLRAQSVAIPRGSTVPVDPVERALAETWADVLGLDSVATDTDFVGLGGDSITAVLVVAACEQRGLGFTTRDLLETRTIARLAPRCRQLDAAPPPARAVAAVEPDRYPLTPLQQTILAHSNGSRAYVSQISAQLRGPLDPDAVIGAWHKVAQRHEALRVFVDVGGPRWSQRIADSVEVPVTVIDLSEHPDPGGELDALRHHEAAPFVWDHAPLTRVLLARLGTDRWWLLWTHSHLIVDGWSEQIVADEVLQLVGGVLPDQLPPALDLTPYLPSIDPSGEPRADLPPDTPARAERDASLARWAERLAGAAPTLVAGPGPFTGGHAHRQRTITMSPAATGALDALALASDTTVAGCLLAAWSLVVAQATGASDALLGVTVSGRTGRQADVVGMFVDTVPLRVDADPDRQFGEYARSVQRRHSEWAPDGTPVSLSAIRDSARLPAGVPMFDAIVVVQNLPTRVAPRSRYGPITVEDIRATVDEQFPLLLDVTIRDRVELTIRWDPERATSSDVEAWLGWIAELPLGPEHAGPDATATASLAVLLADLAARRSSTARAAQGAVTGARRREVAR